MADVVKQILAKPIQLVDQVIQAADEAIAFKQDCADLKSKTEKLALLLLRTAQASNDLYERPTRRIIGDTEQALEKALSVVSKCRRPTVMKRIFFIIPAADFRNSSSQLEDSIGGVSWLLNVTASADELCLIWKHIAILCTGSISDQTAAAASLVSLAKDNDQNGKLIIEEGGVGPLIKLLKEGTLEGQEKAAKAIGLLGRDSESVEHIAHAGVCAVFVKILKEGQMKVQAMVAWAVSELVAHHPKCQDIFHQHNIIRLLVSHIAFETVQEHSKYAIVSKATSTDDVHLANNLTSTYKVNEDDDNNYIAHPLGNKKHTQMHNVVTTTTLMKGQMKPSQQIPVNGANSNHQQQQSLSSTRVSNEGRESEDPTTKAYMKAMSARALSKLAKGNSPICHSITESRALLCFAVLLEKGDKNVQYNSAMAVMEITAVAEQDSDLRKSAFKPNSPACKAVVEQLLRIIKREDLNLLIIPCIRAIGNLARIFRATETRMISPLVKLLVEREAEISNEAAIALTKFSCKDNYLHLDHCKAIISAGGARHLVQLVSFGEQIVKSSALLLLCYIALHVPDSDELAQTEVLSVLKWASKQAFLNQDEKVKTLLQESTSRLELLSIEKRIKGIPLIASTTYCA
ncbi:hypothetical protein CQW23_27388 [Capsicum baccatum]|uniref:DUF7792 domain-containing protein n=1 Tax=Capsicum baccatum TaxID=33114 RepID=A0A2G2VDH5_CAPBA|nr:hypothetical protein CQW23_27388 [Capsicum baccatum]